MNRTGNRRRRGVWLCGLTWIPLLMGCASDPVEVPRDGSIIVVTTTSGGAFDPNGFVVVIDGDSAGVVDVNETKTLRTPEGLHSVAIAGLASNCFAVIPDEAMVRAGSSVQLRLQAACVPTPELAAIRILFAGAEGIVAMNADGSDRTKVISGVGLDAPDISADGARLVFIRETLDDASELWGADVDGTGQFPLVAGSPKHPRWSPDGSEIAYTDLSASGWREVLVTSHDGSRRDQLTDVDRWLIEDFCCVSFQWPSWAPDGSRVAYDFDGSIGIVNRDGTEDHYLVSGTHPVWSMDDRIAYVGSSGLESQDIKVIQADGAGATTVFATPPGTAAQPSDWSSDGTLLLYSDVSAAAGTDIYLLDVERGTTVRVTGDGNSRTPVFWPSPELRQRSRLRERAVHRHDI